MSRLLDKWYALFVLVAVWLVLSYLAALFAIWLGDHL